MKSQTELLKELNEVRTYQKTGFCSTEEFLEFIRLKNEKKRLIMEQIKFNVINN